MSKNDRKAPINIERFTVWKRTETDGKAEYDVPITFAKSLMTFSDSPNVVTDELCGDGKVVDSYYAKLGGTVEYGLTGLTMSDRRVLYGERIITDLNTGDWVVNASSENDVGNYVVAAHMSRYRDGSARLVKYLRVLFSPTQEQEQQVTKSGVTWSTKTISGSYSADPETGFYRYICDGIVPTSEAGKAFVEKWFTEATYHGESNNEGE